MYSQIESKYYSIIVRFDYKKKNYHYFLFSKFLTSTLCPIQRMVGPISKKKCLTVCLKI